MIQLVMIQSNDSFLCLKLVISLFRINDVNLFTCLNAVEYGCPDMLHLSEVALLLVVVGVFFVVDVLHLLSGEFIVSYGRFCFCQSFLGDFLYLLSNCLEMSVGG